MKRPEDSTLTIGAGSVSENQPIFYYAPHKGWDKGTFRGFAKNKPAAPLQHQSGSHSGTKDPPNNSNGRPIMVRNKEGETFDLAVRDVYLPLSDSLTTTPPSDLLALPELHHSVLVHSLRERHSKDYCYTFLGSLLVSLNPFSYTIPHYAISRIEDYLSKAPNLDVHDGIDGQNLAPHPWSIAHRVFHDMRANRKNHSVIISGESGSGKTETCKVVLHYLCCLSADLVGAERPPHPQQHQLGGAPCLGKKAGASNNISNNAAAENIHRLIEKVNASNPIMEAFGNAKTARNDNSSRFGKLLEVQFGSSGEIGAMKISPFLLEKSRCVTASQDERVYHSFYQLVAGASDQMKQDLKIKSVRDFPMLTRGGPVQVQGVNDAKEFEETQNAFIAMGFSKEERDFIWRIVAAVLHLSTVNFVGQQQTAASPSSPVGSPASPRGGLGGIASSARAMFEQKQQESSNNARPERNAPIRSSISNIKTDKEDPQANLPAQLSPASITTVEFIAEKLLKVDVAEFKRLLTVSVSVLKNEEVIKILTRAKAADQRDTICKYLYSSLFYWIIDKINHTTNNNTNSSSAGDFVAANSISILDIFGFEDFVAGNSLEQLCINLANEALQRHYSKHVFERDSEEIQSEGVTAEMVKFVDNEACVQLIMGSKSSLFSMLEDSSLLDLDRGNTDQNLKYLEKITHKHKPDYHSSKPSKSKSVMDRDMSELTTPSDFFSRLKLDTDTFIVKHFASDVRYQVNGFVEKNADTLKDAMKNLLVGSDDGMMQDLLAVGSAQDGSNNEPGSPVSPSPRTPGAGGRGGAATAGRATGIVGQFRRSLLDLLSTLDNTHPNWIRCIRPHPKKAPKMFDTKSVLEQLMATGVLETITQRQRNFPFRLDIHSFVHRFGVVCAGNSSFKRMQRSSLHEKCTAILQAASLGTRGGAQVGRTKVFLRTENLNKLERVRQDRVTIQASQVQKFAESYISRKMKRELEVDLATRRIKRWYKRFKLVKKTVKEYYAELLKKKKERDEVARQEMIQMESKERSLVQTMEKSDRSPYAHQHREGITPLLKAATVHLVNVEPSFREKVSKLEYQERTNLAKLEHKDRKEAKQRQLQREEEEQHAFENALDDLAEEVNISRKEIRAEEKKERASELDQYWTPIHSEIIKLAERIRTYNDQRDRRIERLREEMEKEKIRIKQDEERKIASEARLWSTLGGKEQTKKDIENLVALGLSDSEVEQAMKRFFKSGIPSQMLKSGHLANNIASRRMNEASSSGSSTMSIKDKYLARVHGSVPTSRSSNSSSDSSNHYSPPSNPVTLDGYAHKLRSDYEHAVRAGRTTLLPSEDRFDAAKAAIYRRTTQQSQQDAPKSAIDSARHISSKAKDYINEVKARRQMQEQQQHIMRNHHHHHQDPYHRSDQQNDDYDNNNNNGRMMMNVNSLQQQRNLLDSNNHNDDDFEDSSFAAASSSPPLSPIGGSPTRRGDDSNNRKVNFSSTNVAETSGFVWRKV